jgi:hypothetical protein
MALQDHLTPLENGVDSACKSGVEPEGCNRSPWALSQEAHKSRQRQGRWTGLGAIGVGGKPANPREARNEFMTEPESLVHTVLHLPMSVDNDDGQESQDNSSSPLMGNSSSDDSDAVVSRRPKSTITTRPSLRAISNEPKLSPIADISSLAVGKPSREAEREGQTTGLVTERRELRRADPLSFLEVDSPPVTEEAILQAIAKASENCSPRSVSSFDSIDSSQRSTTETYITTPEPSIGGDCPPITAVQKPSQLYQDSPVVVCSPKRKRESHVRQPKLHPHLDQGQDRYGTPEMARGSVKHPHFPPNALQPRLAAPGQGYPKHLPRAEKLPMTGYELVAAKLSCSDSGATRRGSNINSQSGESTIIRPIYRKFEALNHRLLLHLQDELSELEEQLHRLDTADTQTRRLQNCILPASRRAEFVAGGELQWRKTDILGKIGFKLGQYSKHPPFLPQILAGKQLTIIDHALDSLMKTTSLPPASMSDIEDYRTYLATHNPIAEIETRFLDPTRDLICLDPTRGHLPEYSPSHSSASSGWGELLTPMPHKTTFSTSNYPTVSRGVHSRSTSASSLPPPFPPKPQGGELFHVPSQHSEDPTKDAEYQTGDNTTVTTPTQTRITTPEEFGGDHITTHLRLKKTALLLLIATVFPILTFPRFTNSAKISMAVVLCAGLAVSVLTRKLAEARFWEARGDVRGGRR